MKKTILIFSAILLVLIFMPLIILLVAYLFIDDIAKYAINEYAPKYSPVALSVDAVSIKPFSGSFAIRGINVKNPDSFSEIGLARLGDISINVDMNTVMSDKIKIKSIDIIEPSINFEMKSLTSNNISELLKKLKENSSDTQNNDNTSSDTKKDAKASANETKTSPTVVIDAINISKGKVQATMNFNNTTKSLDVALPDFSIKDIGKQKPQSAYETTIQVVTEILKKVSDVVMKAASIDVKKIADENMNGIVNSVKDKVSKLGIFGKK